MIIWNDLMTEDRIKEILDDPATSFWLKNLIMTGNDRDILDVIDDLKTALKVFNYKWNSNV